MLNPVFLRTIPMPLGLVGIILALPLLSGCQSTAADTARQVLQQQAQEQALARAQSEEEALKRVSKPEVELSLIRKAQEDGRYFASLAYLEAYRQQYGDTPESAALRGEAQRKTGQDEASEQTYRTLVDGPQAAVAWHGLGLLAGAHGNYAQAAEDLGKAAKLRPVDAEYLGDWGYALLRSGDLKSARVPLGQAAELAPDNQRILGNLAVLLLVEGKTAAAEQLMDRSHLSDQARKQVLMLAAQTKASMAAPIPHSSAAPAVPAQGGVMFMTGQHSSLMGRYATDDGLAK
jgi:Flp pilus assembly protein TadD